MAIDFSKYNFFNKLDARARVLVILGSMVLVILVIYFGSRWLSGAASSVGPSQVANAPQNLQSVPGTTLAPEFQRTVIKANEQLAQQAQMTGGSAVPTFINYGQQQTAPSNSCVICSDENINNVKNDLDAWVSQGKVTPEIAQALTQLAEKNVPISEYAAYLDQLVREGKLTPEQARLLLEKYKKQHANHLLQESASTLDALIKSGNLPLDTANELLDLQKKGASVADYATHLQNLVHAGKISPQMAQQLLSQYSQQRAKEVVQQSIASLQRMLNNGEITKEVATRLTELEERMVAVDAYNTVLQDFVAKGKMTPIAAKKILEEFKAQKAAIGPTGSLNKMLADAEAAAYQELSDLLQQGKINKETATQIATAIQKNISQEEFVNMIEQLVQQKQLTPDIAKLKVADYKLVKGLRDEMERLNALQGNNANANTYANELRRAVQAGILTPDQAKQLMQEYQAMLAKGPITPPSADGTDTAFAQLQQRVQNAATTTPLDAAQFDQAPVQAAAETDQDRQNRIQNMMAAMNGQAQQLVLAWEPPTMVHKEGVAQNKDKDANNANKNQTTDNANNKGGADANASNQGPPLIKAGTILFAVLDTAVNSDYPTSPILATVVEGKYKGAKLMGKVVTTKGVSGQMDRVSLNFMRMDTDSWERTKNITAYAIDPDTARAVMASSVNYHYAQRFGAIMATSFLQGYASAITNAGNSTTGIFGTSTTHPELSPSNRFMVGLGQIGQTLGQVTQNYVNIPPTVKVNAGVGLGILFMDDVNA